MNSDGQIVRFQAKKKRFSDVENVLPPEMAEKILKLLKLKEICQAKLVCKRWKEIIVKGNLVKKVAGKMLDFVPFYHFAKKLEISMT